MNKGPTRANFYNNDVTYADKWDTAKNRNYQKMAMAIAVKSDCGSSIPLSWAREVYFFLRHLEQKYGIKYATDTHRGYYYPTFWQLFKLMFWSPIVTLPYTLKRLYRDIFCKPKSYQLQYSPTRMDRVRDTLFGHARGGYFYGYMVLYSVIYARYYNFMHKPKVALHQFKEKFGYVTVYYSAPDDIRKEVDKYIKNLERSLWLKGAYYDMSKKNDKGKASNSNP